jgi:hypothetical protein
LVRNYSSGSGGGYQEQQLVINIETLNYSFDFLNPVFVINVYNIFWQTKSNFIEGQNQRSNFVRRGILPIDSIQVQAFSNESVLFNYFPKL